MDRASLARRRQEIRGKENISVKTNVSEQSTKIATFEKEKPIRRKRSGDDFGSIKASTKAKLKEAKEKDVLVPGRTLFREKQLIRSSKQSKASKTAYNSDTNTELVVHQLLQRSEFGDVKEYLQSITKPELFQQALTMATYVQELKKKHIKVSEALNEGLVQAQVKNQEITSDLAERERVLEDREKEKSELVGRLKLAQKEYQSLITKIREHEDKLKALEATKQNQALLIEEMSKIRCQRDEELNDITKEREQAFRFAEEMHEQNAKLQTQVQDYERLQTELKEAQRGNKQLMLQVHHKKLALEQMSSELEDARTQISTMHGHVQLEAISRHSVTQERDRLQQQYQIDRQNWKSTQEKRDALEKRTADEFRKMDLELRHLNQTLSRLRIEWESEKSQREKSETRLQKLTTFLDETKVHTNALQEETQQLKMQINEEKEARTSKDHALQIAYRDLQTLQKNCREQENAKLDAQSEVASLVQRMKVIRRDHLALLHRVEGPTHLTAQWHAKMQD